MRTFIALDVPQRFRNDTTALAGRLSSTIQGRFLKRETYHVTLAFLGEVDEATASRTIESIEQAVKGTGPIHLHATGLGKFGKSHNATLFLDIQAGDALVHLAERLCKELTDREIYFDRKKFRPHLTLARHARIPKEPLPDLPFPEPEEARTVTLYKSTLTSEGAIYKPLFVSELHDDR